MNRSVYVAGMGSTAFGKHAGTSIEALAVDASAQALVDACIDDGLRRSINGQGLDAGSPMFAKGRGPNACHIDAAVHACPSFNC